MNVKSKQDYLQTSTWKFSVLIFLLWDFSIKVCGKIIFPNNKELFLLLVEVAWVLWVILIIYNKKLVISALFGSAFLEKKKWLWILTLLPLSLSVLGALGTGFYLIAKHYPNTLINLLSPSKSTQPVLLESWFITLMIAPILEEILFRGLILTNLMHKMSTSKALVITSILFAGMHSQSFGIIQFFCGLIFSLAYLHSRSLFVPIVMHMTWNVIPTIIIKLQSNSNFEKFNAVDVSTILDRIISYKTWIVIISIAGISTFVWILVKFWPEKYIKSPYEKNVLNLYKNTISVN